MEAKEPCPLSAENTASPRTAAPPRCSPRCWWGVAMYLNRLEERVPIPIYIDQFALLSFSVHITGIQRFILCWSLDEFSLFLPQEKLIGVCGCASRRCLCPVSVSVCVCKRERETKNLPNFRNTLMCSFCLLSLLKAH